MKKLRKLSFVIVVPVVVGIGLIIAGMATENGTFTTAGLITLYGYFNNRSVNPHYDGENRLSLRTNGGRALL